MAPSDRACDIFPDHVRLDKWLWQARFFKSRSLAADLCRSGLLRINGTPTEKPGTFVSPGDILSFPYGNGVRVIRMTALATRRGSAMEARRLYRDLDEGVSPTPES